MAVYVFTLWYQGDYRAKTEKKGRKRTLKVATIIPNSKEEWSRILIKIYNLFDHIKKHILEKKVL